MAIRTTLYGYQVKNGKTVIHNEESEVVKKVFSLYIEGETLSSIVVVIPFNKLATGTNVSVNAPVATQDSTQEEKILMFCSEAKSFLEIMQMLGYKERKTVRKYLNLLIEQGRVAMTVLDKPNSKNQKYVTLK